VVKVLIFQVLTAVGARTSIPGTCLLLLAGGQRTQGGAKHCSFISSAFKQLLDRNSMK